MRGKGDGWQCLSLFANFAKKNSIRREEREKIVVRARNGID